MRGYCIHRGRRKVIHADELAAMQALHRCREQGRDEKAYYPCKRCGGWHLTSQDPATIGMTWSPTKGVRANL